MDSSSSRIAQSVTGLTPAASNESADSSDADWNEVQLMGTNVSFSVGKGTIEMPDGLVRQYRTTAAARSDTRGAGVILGGLAHANPKSTNRQGKRMGMGPI